MLIILPRSQGNVVGIELSGKVTRDDYINTLIPVFNRVIAEHGKARALIDFADDFSGYEVKALWEDARYGFKHMKQFEKCAVINAPFWANFAIKVMDKITKCKSKVFDKHDRDRAWIFIED